MEKKKKINKRNKNPPAKAKIKQANLLDIFKPVDKNAAASAEALEACAVDTESGSLRITIRVDIDRLYFFTLRCLISILLIFAKKICSEMQPQPPCNTITVAMEKLTSSSDPHATDYRLFDMSAITVHVHLDIIIFSSGDAESNGEQCEEENIGRRNGIRKFINKSIHLPISLR